MKKPVINVAIALLFHKNKVLVGWRDSLQHQGNKYEFPGGKVEKNETTKEACKREILEEVGICIENLQVFDLIQHEYEDIVVHLHIFQGCINDEQMQEVHTPWTLYTREQLLKLKFPKANQVIIDRLYWEKMIKIVDTVEAYEQFDKAMPIYIRADALVCKEILRRRLPKCSHLIVNHQVWSVLTEEQRAEIYAIQFKHDQLMNLDAAEKPIGIRCIASCHDLKSLQRAEALGFDAVFLSPVLETASHPEAIGIGWERFERWSSQINIPVFALGGITTEMLNHAVLHGAYGIAGIRNI